MAKLKTNSGAKKRFTLTGSGKIKRKHAYLRRFGESGRCTRKRASGPVIMFNWNAVRKHIDPDVTASKKVKIYA